MIGKKLTSTQLEFIFENKDKMKQVEIAMAIKVTPACVCKVLKPKPKIIEMNGYFKHDKYYSL